ncbi:MAG TPA: ATP-binding protein [Motilibacterales bacterium]|nr:ATP-binding protein [Motilibacterales bacterium]
MAALAALTLSMTRWSEFGNLGPGLLHSWHIAALAVAFTTIGQMAYVRVRHGGTDEELNFFEVALAAAILLLPPSMALVATLTGVLIGEVVIRRGEWMKVGFNLGNYAISTSAMIVTYNALAGGLPPFKIPSIVSLILGSFVFTAVNLALVAFLLKVTVGASPREVLSEEWRLSALMALGSVGIGSVAAACVLEGLPAILPFAFLPALALWYAYGAAAQHAEARERNKWLVKLGGLLAQHGQGGTTLEESAVAIRQIVGAPQAMVLQPIGAEVHDLREEQILSSVWAEQGPRRLENEELPDEWQTGVVTRLDMGTANPGALLIGSMAPYRRSRIAGRTRGWSLEESDAPVLGALVAAVGSAMRAGAAFSALTEETAKLTAVVDNTSDGIAMVDDAGQVRLWSQTMARMTGVEADQIASQIERAPDIVQTLVAASQNPQFRPDGTPAPVRTRLSRDDGEELEVSISTVRVREAMTSANSDTTGWVSILTVHDETRERRVERMKTDFVATISHELRTPITPIKGYAHLLATRGDRMAPEKRAAALQVISDRADHLARLVDDLLMASKVSDGTRLAIEMGAEELDVIVRQAVSSFPQMAGRITVELPEESVVVQCDRVRVVQCLSNLLGNAEKYTPADSPIDIRADVTEPQVHIHVRDHGPGIPASDQARVFERFYRREDPFTMRTGGAGLGLHIARELAVAMGGGLTLQTPAQGHGAEFVLHLVTEEAPAVTVAQPAPPTQPMGRPPGQPADTPARAEQSGAGHSPTRGGTMDEPQGFPLAAM